MGILSWMGIGKEIATPINAISELYTTDKARLAGEEKLIQTMNVPVTGQQEINKVYASSQNFFNSAWQPMVGWTSGACVALYYVPQMIFANYFWIKLCLERNELVTFPLPPDNIMSLIYLMFGFGGYHLVKGKFIDK